MFLTFLQDRILTELLFLSHDNSFKMLKMKSAVETQSCYGDRSFLVNGPAVWKSLSVALRSPDTSLDIFKDKLKTFLFRTVYWMRVCVLGEFTWYKSPHYYYYYYY